MQRFRFSFLIASPLFLTVVAACSPKSNSGGAPSDSAASVTVASAARDSAVAGGGMRSDSATTSATPAAPSVDQQFLRMMSDHHKGLIALAHETVDRKNPVGVKSEAEALDKKQDAELDEMVTMLEQQYHDAYAPKMTPDNQAMLDSLKTKRGAAYDRAFRQDVIKHHKDGIAMIDQYAAKLNDPKLKTMAEKMKADQQHDITMLEKMLAAGR